MGSRWVCILALFFTVKARAYPEYAVRYNVIRCSACHLSPSGGGPRTVYGKLFGAHGYKLNPVMAQDYISADLRGLFYYPQRPTASKGGMGVMSGSVAGHAALDADKRVHLVLEHNLGGFSAAPYRDTYALFRLSDADDKPHWFESLLVGRFRPPFGVVSDEHRTYTRVQTGTEWYAFQTGVMLSGTPSERIHYDWAVLNGDGNAGDNLVTGAGERWGSVLNLRYMPGPFLVGASGAYYDHAPASQSRGAASVYSIVSFDRWTDGAWPFNLRLEYARARNFGGDLGRGFVSDPAYATALEAARSIGWLARVECPLNERWTLIYKFDYLIPDQDFPDDVYERHGVGFRWMIAPNTMVQARTEIARATHPSEKGGTGIGGQNATFAILQLAL